MWFCGIVLIPFRASKDPRFERLTCIHKGIYADDCICNRVQSNNVYIVATCDKDLKRRLRKIPGVPIMYIKGRRYTVERLPDIDQMGAPRQ
jgi:U3 small nucleolar RNA-associated protein 24